EQEVNRAETHERLAKTLDIRRRSLGTSDRDKLERAALARQIGSHRGLAEAARRKMGRLEVGMSDEEIQRGREGLGGSVEEQEKKVTQLKHEQLNATKEQMAAQHQLNQAKIDDLKTMKEQTAEFAKQATAARKQAENRAQGGKLAIGRMTAEDR